MITRMSMDQLFTHATEYAATKYGGSGLTTVQIDLIKRAAARLSGTGDGASHKDAISRIEASVDLLLKCKTMDSA